MQQNKGSYGREIALRAHQLLSELEHLAKNVIGEEPSDGSLRPTFLLTMAMPIIIQPYERFFRDPSKFRTTLMREFDGYSPHSRLAKGLDKLKAMTSLEGSPFSDVEWRFAHLKSEYGYKLADGMTQALRGYLKQSSALKKANEKAPKFVLEHLRHAMAHGSIMYLNEKWEPSLYGPVKFFLFANARPEGKVDFLLVSVEEFLVFITSWAAWLHDHEHCDHA